MSFVTVFLDTPEGHPGGGACKKLASPAVGQTSCAKWMVSDLWKLLQDCCAVCHSDLFWNTLLHIPQGQWLS